MSADWLTQPCAKLCEKSREEATQRQAVLTKPPGALGRLETLAIRLAAMQGSALPALDKVHIGVFAADHGVVAEGVSAFPQTVTAEMVRNFARGGAAISVMAKQLGASLEVVNLGTVVQIEPLPDVRQLNLGPGTANFVNTPAMSEAQLQSALQAGRDSLMAARANGTELFIGGEMGIGNTTAATAIASVLLDLPPDALAGPGTGLDQAGVSHKAQVIQRALELHGEAMTSALSVLRCVGGFEIAALCGVYLSAAQQGVAVLVDGFIATTAALVAVKHTPAVADWLIYSHASAEPGHASIVDALGVEPLLDLGMRLGEGSGAAVALPLLRSACALHAQMATFAEAGVSDKG